MKALFIDGDYFSYPKGVNSFDELKTFINENYYSFVELVKISSGRTVPPFFVDEYCSDANLNLAQIGTVEEVEVEIMTKDDYKMSLNNAIHEVCTNCDSFHKDKMYCDCGEIQENLCLNGKCEVFTLAEEEI